MIITLFCHVIFIFKHFIESSKTMDSKLCIASVQAMNSYQRKKVATIKSFNSKTVLFWTLHFKVNYTSSKLECGANKHNIELKAEVIIYKLAKFQNLNNQDDQKSILFLGQFLF